MDKQAKIFVAGHRGMVGSAVVKRLETLGYKHILVRTHRELDLLNQAAVDSFYATEKPEVVIIAAAKVGGIQANNTYPAEFLFENLAIAQNTIHSAWKHGTKRLLFLGSTCIYPRLAPQPMPEDCLLSSPLEKTNEAYAIAKIAGLKLCEYYRKQYGVLFHSAMPTNLYGPGDYYHPEKSHVLPALIRRFHDAKVNGLKEVTLWGTGTPRREFLHTDDLSAAVVHLLNLASPPDWVNVGTGTDVTIHELADMVKHAVGLQAELVYDVSKPDGTPRKLVDTTLIRSTGWEPKVSLAEGIERTYRDFLSEQALGALRD
ncbi:MAG: GDP-L-fucose synthase [Verrucomicrobiota bacterium]|nr:GDP-L-fucose synthase [Verrucomicrobiota bacterium]